MWVNFKELQNLLPKYLSLSSKNMGLGSGIWKKPIRIPDPGQGVKKAPVPGSRIRNTVKKDWI